jgi:hypothetical protein
MRGRCKLVTFVPIRHGPVRAGRDDPEYGLRITGGDRMLWIAIGYLGCWAVFVEVAYRSPTIEGVD